MPLRPNGAPGSATSKPLDELQDDFPETVIQGRKRPPTNILRHTSVEGFGNRARDAGHCVRVPAKRDRVANGVFVAVRLQECDDRLRHRPLARYIERIRWPKVSQALIQEVTELL